MNARENSAFQEQLEAINLDDMANEQYWRVTHLRDMLIHMEEYLLNEVRSIPEGFETLNALIFGAKELSIQAERVADRFMVNANGYRRHLMDMPDELLPKDDEDSPILVLRNALRIATGPMVSKGDLEGALEMVADIVYRDARYADDLHVLERIVEMHGYTVGWLSSPAYKYDKPRLAPKRRSSTPITSEPVDARSLLTAEEITTAARGMACSLEAYLVEVLSHPANIAI